MDQKRDRLYPSAPLEKIIDLEKRLEKKINEVNSFNNHINNIKEMILPTSKTKTTNRKRNIKSIKP